MADGDRVIVVKTNDGRDVGQRAFMCPACETMHLVMVGEGDGPRWAFNEDMRRPTFDPSMRGQWTERGEPKVCHSFVRDGRIQFFGDCTHDMAGQTVDLPEEPWWPDDT